MTGVVINYYNPSGNSKLFFQTLLCVSSYLEQEDVLVLLSDGSGVTDPEMLSYSVKMNFHYQPSSKRLSFAEGYNQGISFFAGRSDVRYVVLSANDIIAAEHAIPTLVSAFSTHRDIGCVIPYLTKSDYHLQNEKFAYKDRIVPLMTLNCNAFLKEDLIAIGGVPEYLSGYFNDIVMASKLFEKKKRILLMADVVLIHLAGRTVAVGSSANFTRDQAVFLQKHGELSINEGSFVMNAQRFTTKRTSLFYSWLQKNLSWGPLGTLWPRIYYYRYNLEQRFFKKPVKKAAG